MIHGAQTHHGYSLNSHQVGKTKEGVPIDASALRGKAQRLVAEVAKMPRTGRFYSTQTKPTWEEFLISWYATMTYSTVDQLNAATVFQSAIKVIETTGSGRFKALFSSSKSEAQIQLSKAFEVIVEMAKYDSRYATASH